MTETKGGTPVDPADTEDTGDKPSSLAGATSADEAHEVVPKAQATADADEAAAASVLQAELDRLRDENERLKASDAVTQEERHARSVRIWRWIAAAVLIVLGAFLAFWGIGAYWVNSFLMDTNTFVETLAPLGQNPSVQKAVSDAVDNAVFKSVNVEAQLTTLLTGVQDLVAPELAKRGVNVAALPAQALAAPLASAIENAVRDQTSKFIASQQFQDLFVTALREGHQAFLAALQGTQQASDNGLIAIDGDTVYLNVNAFATTVKARLVANGFGFLEKIPLTRANGQVALFSSPTLINVLLAIRILNLASWMLPLAALVLLAAAVFAAPDRRRSILWIGVALMVVTLIGLLGINVGRVAVTQVAQSSGIAPAAVLAAYNLLPQGLIRLLRLVLSLGLIMALGAVLTGPARWAVGFRTWLSQLVEGTGPGAELSEFVQKFRTPLAGGGVVLGVLVVVVWPSITAIAVFWIAVIVLAWVFAVETIGRRGKPVSGSTPQA